MSNDTEFEPAENGDMQEEERSAMSLPPRQIVFTVGDLRSLLKDVSDDMLIEVASVPDATGWTQWILNMIHQDDEKVVLALSEGTCSNDEEDLTFYCDGRKMRPVE